MTWHSVAWSWGVSEARAQTLQGWGREASRTHRSHIIMFCMPQIGLPCYCVVIVRQVPGNSPHGTRKQNAPRWLAFASARLHVDWCTCRLVYLFSRVLVFTWLLICVIICLPGYLLSSLLVNWLTVLLVYLFTWLIVCLFTRACVHLLAWLHAFYLIHDWWVTVDDWCSVIDGEWLVIDDWDLMLGNWWLVVGDWWLVIGD